MIYVNQKFKSDDLVGSSKTFNKILRFFPITVILSSLNPVIRLLKTKCPVFNKTQLFGSFIG